ncbi:DUF1467 family protein [Pseudohalocynthiibacter aestuariivivens]|jgi:predicted secreted protein|uniref:DUF1467 family protein n=1 Tax=Pseudohalocynthiibacter aestuariivivens TaxID=1591409 RepID=A0ABV5JD24_9RHOB|nr:MULTISPECIES: DUF1467 family protein [Pseudohalocynthiibacter]MBS9717155.1 DUF1467 family protein [Pseudohalocynthiibacter aestuariivivens]MCK0103742.1 DUF1467 family protein [Pseudohalocynthiibacter sp. F2068]
MSITSAIVLFAVLWFLVMLCVLPIRLKTQDDVGEIVPGTHAGAPHNPQIGKKAKITTAIASVLWVVIAGILFSGKITVRDIDWFNRMGPAPVIGETNG